MRLHVFDAVKALASQLILLHHLSLYSPMAQVLEPVWPSVFAFLSDPARCAVQLFLVMGGYLAAQSLYGLSGQQAFAQSGSMGRVFVQLVWKRFVRLGRPYWLALLFVSAALLVAHRFDPSIDAPQIPQLLAHAFMLHDITGMSALSAGVWYVAIDFQLYAVLAAVLCLCQALGRRLGVRPSSLALAACLGLMAAALFHFNLDPRWDTWALYFFGSYGLGVMAFWASRQKSLDAFWVVAAVLALVVTAALSVQFRERILLAGFTAMGLMLAVRFKFAPTWTRGRVVRWLGDVSYPVFLVHYPVVVLAGVAAQYMPEDSLTAHALMWVFAWGGSLMAGHALLKTTQALEARNAPAILVKPESVGTR